MRKGMVIDLDACIGCQTCAVSCKVHNALPPTMWWNRVATLGAEVHQTAVGEPGGALRMDFLPLSCQHCENPACEKVCPTGATYSTEDGTVLIDFERCIGCRYCFAACPYGVRQFNWKDPRALKEEAVDTDYGYPGETREDGRLVYTQHRPVGVTEKCTFCAQYTAQGIEPTCVRACPQQARLFGDLDDPESKPARALASKQAIRLKEEYGTRPKVYYVTASKVVQDA
ncbi:4Fe-4S dicluster domain-containing protein [Arabiibacter massiliensis]|uniref:4Fe-4S dicluster domain-containing protein n=1 Tax=Arabiibacter massiliensis TaxID=1870985 RepID=UPI0009BA2EB4|nr:4Fe-4S dicluster domain-containing protein [Arabiibacter massiliensis]